MGRSWFISIIAAFYGQGEKEAEDCPDIGHHSFYYFHVYCWHFGLTELT